MSADQHLDRLIEQELTRRELLKRSSVAGAALLLPAFLAERAAAQPGTAAGAEAQPTLSSVTWALPATIRSLDYLHSNDTGTSTVLSLGLEGLLYLDHNGKLRPRLARSWFQPDNLTYIYKLRGGVKWWDGTPFTADDVAFSWGQNLDPKVGSQQTFLFANVKSIEATAPDEVTVKLNRPDSLFQYMPANDAGYIVQKQFSLQHPKDIGTPSVLTMGTGPFRITRYVPDQGLSLVRNETYWGTKPAVKRLELKFIVEPTTRLLAMRTGEIDGAFDVPLDRIGNWKSLKGVNVISEPQLSCIWFSFDMDAPPWNDIHVRRAVAHSLDRRGLIKAVLGGQAQPAVSIVPPIQWGNVLGPAQVKKLYASFPSYEFNLKKAKAELAQSSASGGFKASIQYSAGWPQTGQIALSLRENLKQIGIELQVTEVTAEKYFADLYGHENLGIQILLWTAQPDPIPSLNFASAAAKKNGFNFANFKNPEVDRLITLANTTLEPSKRANAIARALRIAAEELPYLPVAWPNIAVAVSDKLAYRGFDTFYPYTSWASYLQQGAKKK